MNIYVLDENLDRVHLVTKYRSMTWVTAFQEAGNFTLVCGLELFPVFINWEDYDSIIFVECTQDPWHLGVVECVEKTLDENNNKLLTVKGRTCEEAVLLRRVPYKTTTYKEMEAVDIIQAILNDNVISPELPSRQLPVVYASSPIHKVISYQVGSDKNVYEHIKDIANKAEFGFMMSIADGSPGNLAFTAYTGVDRSIDNDGTNDRLIVSRKRGIAAQIEFYSDITIRGTQVVGRMSGENIGDVGKTLLYPNTELYFNALKTKPANATFYGKDFSQSSGVYFSGSDLTVTVGASGSTISNFWASQFPSISISYNLVNPVFFKVPLTASTGKEFSIKLEFSYIKSNLSTRQTEINVLLSNDTNTKFVSLPVVLYSTYAQTGTFGIADNGVYQTTSFVPDKATFGINNSTVTLHVHDSNKMELVCDYNGTTRTFDVTLNGTRRYSDFTQLYVIIAEPNSSSTTLCETHLKNVSVEAGGDLIGSIGYRRFEKPFDLTQLNRTVEGSDGKSQDIPEADVENSGRNMMAAYLERVKPKLYVTGKLPPHIQKTFRDKFNLGDIVTVIDEETGYSSNNTVLNAQEIWSVGGYDLQIDIGDRSPVTDEEVNQ